MTGIRHWSTPDYTRVAIDLQDEVNYQFGRIPNPDRVFFDLHNTHLSSTLKGKTFDVEDGFLHKIRVAQYQQDDTRIVLEMDDVADYSAFLLPNPYRLIIDVHGKHPQKMAKAEPAKPAPREAEKKAAKAASEPAPKPAARAEVTRSEPVADKKREPAAGASAAPAGKAKPDATFDELSETVAKVNPPEAASKAKKPRKAKPNRPSQRPENRWQPPASAEKRRRRRQPSLWPAMKRSPRRMASAP